MICLLRDGKCCAVMLSSSGTLLKRTLDFHIHGLHEDNLLQSRALDYLPPIGFESIIRIFIPIRSANSYGKLTLR